MFTVTGSVPDSPSHRRAREVLPPGGGVLDVGCGGGRAALALAPPAGRLVGVDTDEAMLTAFAAAAHARGVAHTTLCGQWPSVAPQAPVVDVAVCHHVAYNVADLAPFAVALTEHARRRVVLELPSRHPLTWMAPLWRQFWNLDRPDGPTADDCVAVLREAGLPVQMEGWLDDGAETRAPLTDEQRARVTRVRLCLPPQREPEVAEALRAVGPRGPRRTVTVWWDVDGSRASRAGRPVPGPREGPASAAD